MAIQTSFTEKLTRVQSGRQPRRQRILGPHRAPVGRQDRRRARNYSGHEDQVNSAAFSPDGSFVVPASDDKTARLWDAKTGAALATLSAHGDTVISAAF